MPTDKELEEAVEVINRMQADRVYGAPLVHAVYPVIERQVRRRIIADLREMGLNDRHAAEILNIAADALKEE